MQLAATSSLEHRFEGEAAGAQLVHRQNAVLLGGDLGDPHIRPSVHLIPSWGIN
jgi:hypothetical protein